MTSFSNWTTCETCEQCMVLQGGIQTITGDGRRHGRGLGKIRLWEMAANKLVLTK
jgi:hypothetical protein